jgi:acylphosphatase
MSQKENQARRFFVAGRVQGVGYRVFVQRVAEELDLRGFVRNRRDGRVEVFAMGEPEKLLLLRKELKKGPMMSDVSDVNEEPATVDTQYSKDFSVEYTL